MTIIMKNKNIYYAENITFPELGRLSFEDIDDNIHPQKIILIENIARIVHDDKDK